MATEETLEPASQEPEGNPDTIQNDQTPEAPGQDDPQGDSDTDNADVATLQKRLRDKDSYITKLEAKVPKAKKEEIATDDEIDWKIENAQRIKIVKPEYNAYLARGIPRNEALRLAELDKGVTRTSDTSENARQAANSGETATIDRSKTPPMRLTEHDKRLGLTAERKKELAEKYPDLREE